MHKLVRQRRNDDRVHTDISAWKIALMSEDLPQSRCDGICTGSTACVIDDTHFSDNENSESVDDSTVVVMFHR